MLNLLLGGGNIIEQISFSNKIAYDNNKELIAFYQYLQNDGTIPLPNSFDRIHYNEVKDSFKKKDGKYEDWYYGYMMIVPSYNGKVWGSFAKDGSRLYQKEHYESVLQQIKLIQDVKFQSSDYKDLNFENCVIYCDPPYANSKKEYYNKNFNTDEFWKWAEEQSKNNKIYVSECQAPDNWKIIWQKPYKRTVANQTKGIDTIEKLFTL